jgi:hypothetical protein
VERAPQERQKRNPRISTAQTPLVLQKKETVLGVGMVNARHLLETRLSQALNALPE